MRIAYTIILHLFYFAMLLAAWFNKKSMLWIRGRKKWRHKLRNWKRNNYPVFWFHAASLGEFEQGLPVIEALKNHFRRCSIVISFFSSSGYEVRKNYSNADIVFYLPLDTGYNAKTLIDILKPDAVFFIKYEFWYFYLTELRKRSIPVYLLSGIFRPQQIFFRWYGLWFKKNLKAFNHLFLQNDLSSDLLKSIGVINTSVTGDTRFDRVKHNAEKAVDLPVISNFSAGSYCIVAGSTWPADEELLTGCINNAPPEMKFILAPHEISQNHLNKLIGSIKKNLILYSFASRHNVNDKQVLIIDNVGMLSSVYRYAKIAYIGGGFGKGIHNILEAAVYRTPVVFGPNYHKFHEAGELIAEGGAFAVSDGNELNRILNLLMSDGREHEKASESAARFIKSHTGATDKIMKYLEDNLKI